MLKSQREARQLLTDMGLTILSEGRTKRHHTFQLRAPDGREFWMPMPGDITRYRTRNNFTKQVRHKLEGRE